MASVELDSFHARVKQIKSVGWSNSLSYDLFYWLRSFYDRHDPSAASTPPGGPYQRANAFEPSSVTPHSEILVPPGSEFEEIGNKLIVPQLTRVRRWPSGQFPDIAQLHQILLNENFTYYLSRRLFDYPESTCNAAALLMLVTNQFEFGPLQQVLISDSSTLQILIKCVDSHSHYVQFWCIGVLRNLARNEDCVQLILHAHGIEPLVEKLTKDTVARGIAASALANLAYDNEENRKVIAAYGGVEGLIYTIQSTKSRQTLWEATGALGNLSYKSEENKQRIANAGGLSLLISLLDAESDDVVGSAASTIENLCSNSEEFRIKCAEQGVVGRLIKLLASTNEYVQDGSCGALFNLSINIETRAKIVEQGAIPRLIALLTSSSDDVLYRATGVLHNVSCNNQLTSSQIDEEDALPRIIALLSSSNELIQENASGTLMNLGCVDSKAIQIAKCGGIKALVELLQRTKDDQVTYRVAGALFNISFGHSANKRRLLEEGGLAALLTLVQQSTHPRVLEYSLGTINMLALDVAEALPRLASAQLVEHFLTLMSAATSTHRVELEARNLLMKLAEQSKLVVAHALVPAVLRRLAVTNQALEALANEERFLNASDEESQDSAATKAKLTSVLSSMNLVLDKIKATMKAVMDIQVNVTTELKGFAPLVNSTQYHDMEFIVGAQRIFAHRAVIFARCPYFQALMERWLPSNASASASPANIVQIPVDTEASPAVFVELMRFIYTGNCEFDEENMIPLLELSDLYCLPALTALCEVHIMASATPTNAMDLLAVSQRYNARKLHSALVGYALTTLTSAELPATHWDLFAWP